MNGLQDSLALAHRVLRSSYRELCELVRELGYTDLGASPGHGPDLFVERRDGAVFVRANRLSIAPPVGEANPLLEVFLDLAEKRASVLEAVGRVVVERSAYFRPDAASASVPSAVVARELLTGDAAGESVALGQRRAAVEVVVPRKLVSVDGETLPLEAFIELRQERAPEAEGDLQES